MRGELETRTDCYILTLSSSDHGSTFFAFWLGCSIVGHWGLQALSLQADSHAGILSPTDSNSNWNWLTQAVCGTWLYNCLTLTCFLWAYASATITEFSNVHRSRWYSYIFDRMHLFGCSSAYLHRCMSWLTARVNMLQCYHFRPEWAREKWQWRYIRYSLSLQVISRTLVEGEFYLSAEMQSMYSIVPADWAISSYVSRCMILWLDICLYMCVVVPYFVAGLWLRKAKEVNEYFEGRWSVSVKKISWKPLRPPIERVKFYCHSFQCFLDTYSLEKVLFGIASEIKEDLPLHIYRWE